MVKETVIIAWNGVRFKQIRAIFVALISTSMKPALTFTNKYLPCLRRCCNPPVLVMFVAVGMFPGVVLAGGMSRQSALTADPAREQGHGHRLIEEVIVTATRREADAQSVPLSVQVLTAEDLARLGAADFADYARTVPGLTFTDAGLGGEKQTIRGISTDNTTEVNPTTALYLDEVPITNAGGTGLPYNPDPLLVDIQRIEVLRGPQGTLFGASAMGGAIRIITNKPNLSRTEGFVGASLSSIKRGSTGYEFNGMLNVPLHDGQAALRAVGYHRDRYGYVDNLAAGDKDVNNNAVSGGRISATIKLADNAGLTGAIVYQDRQSDGTDIEDMNQAARRQSRLDEPNEDEWINYNLVAKADFAWGSLLSSTSFLDRTIDTKVDLSGFFTAVFAFDNPLTVINQDDVGEFVQELRVVSKAGQRFNWLAGVFYQDQDLHFSQDFPAPGFDSLTGGLASMFSSPDDLFVGRSQFTLEQVALYGELSYQLTDHIDLVAGARWFDINRDYKFSGLGLFAGGDISDSGSASESDVMPKFSLSYAASENLSVYATAAEGFRSGGVNTPEGTDKLPGCVAELNALGLAKFPTAYGADSLWSYELGAKSHWFDGRVQLNAALYHIDWSDMQTFKLLDCGAGFIENAGKANGDGIELNVVSHPVDNVDINLAASYNEAKLQNDVPNLGGRAGDRIPGVARLTANLGMSYYLPMSAGREAFIHGDYQYVGSSFNQFDRAARSRLPSYHIVNFRLGLNTAHWSGVLFIHNAFDERGILTINDTILGQWVTATPPRSIGFSLSRRY